MKTLSLPHKFIAILTMLFSLFGATLTAQAQTVYALKVAGVTVTPENADNITGKGITGEVSYNHKERTLYLDNATITSSIFPAIETKMTQLKIYIKGVCTLKSVSKPALDIENECQFSYMGVLNLESRTGTAVQLHANSHLYIGSQVVNIKGKNGISGVDGQQGEKLTIDYSKTTIEGTSSAISHLSQFTHKNNVIEQPEGAVWNDELHALCDAEGNIVKGKVFISQCFLRVAGIKVTPENAANITGEGISGKVSYDDATRTLTLDNATITTKEIVIRPAIEGLTIEVIGNNTLKGLSYWAVFYCDNSFTLRGSGTLNTEGRNAFLIFPGSTVTLENCTVNAKGKWGIGGQYGTAGETLIIKNANVTVEGENGSIYELSQFTLDGCRITQPAGAVWNSEKHAVCNAEGNTIRGKVVIERIPQGIDGVNANAARRHGIYNLSGQQLETDFDHLPHGVYIVNGQKRVK